MDPSGHPGLLLIPEWDCYACGVCNQYANSTDPDDSHRKSAKHVNAMARSVAPHVQYYLKPDCELSNFHGMKLSQRQEHHWRCHRGQPLTAERLAAAVAPAAPGLPPPLPPWRLPLPRPPPSAASSSSCGMRTNSIFDLLNRVEALEEVNRKLANQALEHAEQMAVLELRVTTLEDIQPFSDDDADDDEGHFQ